MSIHDLLAMKKRLARGLVALIVLAAMGHFYYWYWPRLRPSNPRSTSQVARLVLSDAGHDIRVWVPYPHQNLGALERRLDSLDSISVAMEEFLGTAPLDLPSFGPFRLPPASEMAIALDQSGKRVAAAARVYPVAAWLFRAAGWLADNPWMAGGDLILGERNVHVEWEGTLWRATTGDWVFGGESAGPVVEECLGLLRLGRPLGPVPDGLFRFDASGGRVLLSSNLETGTTDLPDASQMRMDGVALSWTRTVSTEDPTSLESTMVLSRQNQGRGALPPLMVVQTPGSVSRQLPGERILRAVGAEVHSRSLSGWELRTYDKDLLLLGERLVEQLEAFLKTTSTQGTVSLGYVDLDEARAAVSEVGQALSEVPVIGEAEARAWLAFAEVLASLADYSSMSIWLDDSDRVEVEIRSKRVD